MPERRLSSAEFIALMAMLFATIAFSIDAMLPALDEIERELTPTDPNRAQLILTSFVLGMGIGTFFTGPLSDWLGRKPVILGGLALYIVAAFWAMQSQSLEWVLAARLLQGIGAAGPRVVALAIIRDLYEGPGMARLMSFVMIVFTMVPAIAPLLGSFIIWGFGWRAIFLAFISFAVLAGLWLFMRQPETLAKEHRRPMTFSKLAQAMREMFGIRIVVLSILAQSLGFGVLFGHLSTIQPIFDETFDRAASFPYWFALIAIIAAGASRLNAAIVERVGMRPIVEATFAGVAVFSFFLVGAVLIDTPNAILFPVYILWSITLFGMAGLTIGNLNAIAMQPLGHIAGFAASIIGSFATVAAVIIAAPIGLAFNGTPLSISLGVTVCAACAVFVTRMIR